MDKAKITRSELAPDRPTITTIDDLVQQAEQLAAGLRQLSQQKYPLDIRRGHALLAGRGEEVSAMREQRADSRQVRAGSRTYFLDLEQSEDGRRYLKITESRFKGEGQERERHSLVVFPEAAQGFAQAVRELVEKLA